MKLFALPGYTIYANEPKVNQSDGVMTLIL